jgi:hypothetical protein
MGKTRFEEQAVAGSQAKSVPIDFVTDRPFKAIHEFDTGVYDRSITAIRLRL